jgi:hypothetical protein
VGSSGWIACHSWSGTRVSAVVVMAADHAHSQGRQQDPDEGRKHALSPHYWVLLVERLGSRQL